jgi:hypothetical protein
MRGSFQIKKKIFTNPAFLIAHKYMVLVAKDYSFTPKNLFCVFVLYIYFFINSYLHTSML